MENILEKEAKQPDTKKRSASYPVLTVEQAFNYANTIYNKFGADTPFTREEIAKALEVHANTISREVAACAQYGFFTKADNEGNYRVTPLFYRLHNPEGEKDKRLCYLTAFGNPKLNQELIQKFDGLILPEELHNSLVHHNNITEAASKAAADVFIKSGIFVGAINPDNRGLKYKVTLSTVSKTQYAEILEERPNDPKENGNNEEQRGGGVQSLAKMIEIQNPTDTIKSSSDKSGN